MTSQAVVTIEQELQQFLSRYGTTISERHIIAWDGYLAGLYLHEVLSLTDYTYLASLLPKVENNPVMEIFLGVDDEDV